MHRRRTHVDPPAAELDEHEDVEGPEPGGLDGEEVAGDDPVRLCPQELGPGRAAASRSWPRSRRSEQGPYRRRAHAEAELAELAPDPDAAPARVLPGESQDERTELGIDRGPARATDPAIGPLPLHQLAVPPEEGGRRDDECDPPITDCLHPPRRMLGRRPRAYSGVTPSRARHAEGDQICPSAQGS